MSEFERKHWVEALGGTWPAINTLQKLRADSVEDNLNSMAFTFLKDCLQELENRGLNDQGLYRVGGVVSKVKNLLNEGLIGSSDKEFDLSDPKQWESKTIASAVKQYFRDLNKPLMTHTLYASFVEAVKNDSSSEVAVRMEQLVSAMKRLPVANREMLKVLIRHLAKVAAKNQVNLMTAANLGVVFGPTLLRPKEETVASIMDIKFCNEVVESLIENCDTFFPLHSDSSPEGPTKRKGRAPPVPIHDHREQRGSSTPKRTHSFSSFSQLSTNSLPDIKELHPSTTVLTIANHHKHFGSHHHHHHHHHHPVVSHGGSANPHQDVPDQGQGQGSRNGGGRKFTPLKPLVKATSKDEDLMASLEMMESLAADLPPNNLPHGLKRSYTVQHRRLKSSTTPPSENNKPPLPKLSSPPVISSPTMSSDTSSTGSSASSANHHFTTAKQVLASRMHSTTVIATGSSPNIHVYPTSSPRPNRPKELFVRQITLPMETSCNANAETPIVPSPSLVTPATRSQVPPPIPARRYPRAYHQVTTVTMPSDERSTSDSGVLTSPSPPTDSGIAMMSPPTHVRGGSEVDKKAKEGNDTDTVSLCSSSAESDSCTSGGSRYDNVHYVKNNEPRRYSNDTTSSKTSTLVAAAAEIAARRLSTSSPTREISTQTIEDGECDGDDEDEDTSDGSSSDILVLDSSSSETAAPAAASLSATSKKYFVEQEDELLDGSKNHDEIEISDHFRRRGNKFRTDSSEEPTAGPYDNFTLPGAVLQVPVVHHKTTSVAVNAPAPQGSAAGSKTKAHHSSSVSSSVMLSSLGSNRICSPEVMGSNPGPTKVQLVRHNSHHEEHLEPASIKRLLATGPTSNV